VLAGAPNIVDFVVAGAVFGLAASVFLALVLWKLLRRTKREENIKKRLQLQHPSSEAGRVLRLWRDGGEVTTTVEDYTSGRGLLERIDRVRRDAGWTTPLSTLILALFGITGLVVAASLFVSHSLLLALMAGLTVVVIVWLCVRRSISKRTALFERQLVDSLQLAARSLRAGHPLLGAFQLIADDMEDPVRTIFADICQKQQMGVGLGVALQQAGAESSSPDMKLFATSVTIQLRSGGNLADMMDRVSFVIRERIRLARRVRVLIAQTQFSKRVLLALPFLLFVLLNIMNPGYMEILYSTTVGKVLLGLAAAGLLLGTVVMNRLAEIRW
jgi:tight adherence protein B